MFNKGGVVSGFVALPLNAPDIVLIPVRVTGNLLLWVDYYYPMANCLSLNLTL
jgi:uncharacterized protein involved in cysteine biosynthesis